MNASASAIAAPTKYGCALLLERNRRSATVGAAGDGVSDKFSHELAS